jgi:hypothetical protein
LYSVERDGTHEHFVDTVKAEKWTANLFTTTGKVFHIKRTSVGRNTKFSEHVLERQKVGMPFDNVDHYKYSICTDI